MRIFSFIAVCLIACATSASAVAQSNPPQMYRSPTFQVMTDLPPAQAKELMERLETMIKLVSGYFGSPCRKPIRMYVVKHFENWPPAEIAKMDPSGVASIQSRGGLTITTTRSLRNGPKIDADCVVYAVADHGTPQHEAVHAYCGVTFGETGPVWYSEGMAEVGQYWREGDKGVNAADVVIDYLRSQPPKPLNDIVNNPIETTGDSWQNYAWRWALCHLLGFNENYSPRFKPLGLAFVAGANTSFDAVYGLQAQEIEFEYRLFLKDLAPGYRCDLCSWDWKTRFKALTGSAQVVSKIAAGQGWQASRGIVTAGTSYLVTTSGEWTLAKGEEPRGAEGDESGHGRLEGIIFHDYQLSEPFDVGGLRTFVPPVDGQLFLRCRDDWGSLADNKGSITVRIKRAPD
jgi:hypothetical protein